MSTDPSTTEQIAAAVLAEHVYVTFGYCGGCEWHADFEHDWDAGDANPYPDQHRAHVAQQIAARLDDGLRAGIEALADDLGLVADNRRRINIDDPVAFALSTVVRQMLALLDQTRTEAGR